MERRQPMLLNDDGEKKTHLQNYRKKKKGGSGALWNEGFRNISLQESIQTRTHINPKIPRLILSGKGAPRNLFGGLEESTPPKKKKKKTHMRFWAFGFTFTVSIPINVGYLEQ